MWHGLVVGRRLSKASRWGVASCRRPFPKAFGTMTALLSGTYTFRGCLSARQAYYNFLLSLKNRCLRISVAGRNACLPEFLCEDGGVHCFVHVPFTHSLLPVSVLVSALAHAHPEAASSAVLLCLNFSSVLKVPISLALPQANDASAFTFYHPEVC